jgi:putative salt-induced outer membrane protein YdiY
MFSTKTKFLIVLVMMLLSVNAYSQDSEKKLGWFFEGKLSGLWTGGNSSSTTFGLGATLKHIWENSEFRFDAGGTQTQSSLSSFTAIGTTGSFEVKEETKTEKTAEIFYARGRYDYNFSKHFYALGGVDWLRNRFAGIESRYLLAAGVGNTWVDEETIRFKTDYSFTYSFQNDVVENPLVKNKFPGLRFSYDFWDKLTASTEFESILIVDWNLDNTKDVRADFINSLPITISEMFTLKPSLQLLWRNEPALNSVALYAPGSATSNSTVTVPLKELDTLFALTLVVKI